MSIKNINIAFDEKEFAYAQKKKGNRTWKQVLLDGLESKEDQKK